jgi:MFS family permease
VSAQSRSVVPVLALAGVLVSLQATILVPILARLPEIYGVSSVTASWLVTATTIVGALATPVVSRLADVHGKRRMLLIALGVTVAGSVLLALTHTYALALVGRAMQGFGSALMPVALSVLKDVLPPARMPSAVATISATLAIGAALGLPVAGVLYTALGWSALFWMTALVGTAVAVAVWLVLPTAQLDGPRTPFDWLGSALLMFALVPLLLVLTQGNVWGWTSGAVLGAAGLAVVAAAGFVWWELRSRSPLVDVRLAATRPVLLTNIASLLISMGMFTNMLITSVQLGAPLAAGGLALSVGLVGLLAAIPAAVQTGLAPLVGRLITRFGPRAVFLGGAVWMGSAYVVRLFVGASAVAAVGGAILVTLGSGFTLSSLSVLIMESAPRDRVASVNGLNALCRMIGSSTATATLAAVTAVTAVTVGGLDYASHLTHHVMFAGLAVVILSGAVLMLFVRPVPAVTSDEVLVA